MKSFPQCSSSHFLNSQGRCRRWDLNKVFMGTCYTECVQLCTPSCWFYSKFPFSNLSECLIKSWQAFICIPELYTTMYVWLGSVNRDDEIFHKDKWHKLSSCINHVKVLISLSAQDGLHLHQSQFGRKKKKTSEANLRTLKTGITQNSTKGINKF